MTSASTVSLCQSKVLHQFGGCAQAELQIKCNATPEYLLSYCWGLGNIWALWSDTTHVLIQGTVHYHCWGNNNQKIPKTSMPFNALLEN